MKIKPQFNEPSLEAELREAEKVAGEPHGLDRLRDVVEAPWDPDQVRRLRSAGEAFAGMLRSDCGLSNALKRLSSSSIENIEAQLRSSEGRDKLFGRGDRVFRSCEGVSFEIAHILEKRSLAAFERYIHLCATVQNEAGLEYLERDAAETVLQRAGLDYKRAPKPLGLGVCLNILSEAGGFSLNRPLLRIALRDYYALAFRCDGGETRLLSAADWIHRPLPPAEEEGWRFMLVDDLPRELRGDAGSGPRAGTDVAWEHEVVREMTKLVETVGGVNPYVTRHEFVRVCQERFGLRRLAAERFYSAAMEGRRVRYGPSKQARQRLSESVTLIESVTHDLESRRPGS